MYKNDQFYIKGNVFTVKTTSQYVDTLNDTSRYSSIEGEVDGEHYDFKNHYCTFKKSEILAIRGTKLMMNESEEVPYVVANGYTTNMSKEAEDVINKYKNLLIALEPFRKEFMKNHSGLQLQSRSTTVVNFHCLLHM